MELHHLGQPTDVVVDAGERSCKSFLIRHLSSDLKPH